MAAGDLVTSSECLAALTALTAAQQGELAAVIASASAAIENYCNRTLASRAFDELHAPGRSRSFRLRQPQVTALALYTAPASVLSVRFTSATASRAAVAYATTGDAPTLAATGLTLTSRTAGVDAVTALDFAAYPTASALAAAVGAVPGWSASVPPALAGFAAADLTPVVGARSCLNAGADLWAFTQEVGDYDLDPQSGVVTLGTGWPTGPGSGPWGWGTDTYRYPDRTWGADPRWGQVRCAYTAGFTAIPAEVRRACILTVKSVFDTEPFPGTFSMEKLSAGTSSYSYQLLGDPAIIPAPARKLLANYVRVGA